MKLLITELAWGLVLVFSNMFAYSESPPSGCFCPSWLVSWQPLHGFSLRLNGHNSLKDMDQHQRSHSWQSSGSTAGHRDVVHAASALPSALTAVKAQGGSLGSSVPMSSPPSSQMGITWGTAASDLSPRQTQTVSRAKAAHLAVGILQGSSGAEPAAGAHRAQCWRFRCHLRMDQTYLDIT